MDFLGSTDSRIRVETQRISGEDFEVWRWIGVMTPDKKIRGASNHLVKSFRMRLIGTNSENGRLGRLVESCV